ncbi:carboxy methyl transferase for protein phosphatase 2A [Coemansia sp. Benny D160-2]|nr:carboxy methyl transferase for protein phosphatase 2A [Coemansia sp. Benny D160-2]
MDNRDRDRGLLARSTNDDSDAPVQETSNDAAVSRDSAARLGYINDPWIRYFVKRPQRRAPLINRGTYSRFHGIQGTLKRFASAVAALRSEQSQGKETEEEPAVGQVVVLGAGMDTSYFLMSADSNNSSVAGLRFFEVDFPEITAKKAATVWRTRALHAMLPTDTVVASGGTELHSATFNLLAGDLRDFETSVVPKLRDRGFDPAHPTLFVSECVLIYLDSIHSDAILDWITANVPAAGIVTYEQILPSDRFGQMMIANLRARGLELRGLYAYPSLESTAQRFLSRGWKSAQAVDLAQYHDSCIPPSEHDRLSAIELLDEWEEFRLLASHYAFTFACTRDSEVFKPAMEAFL